MAKDERWPFVWFIVIRSIQLLFGIIVLGMASYICSFTLYWAAGMSVFISLVVVIWTIINFVLFFLGLLLPIAVVVVDAFCVFFLLISMAGIAATGILASDCTFSTSYYSYYYFTSSTYTSTLCEVAKGGFSLLLLSMFLFIATLVYASMILHKTRKDLRGKKYNQGLPYIGDLTAEEQVGGLQYEQKPPQKPAPTYTSQPVVPVYVPPQEQFYPQQPISPVYPAYGGGFVSPPISPPPPENMYEMHTRIYSNAAETSGIHQQRQPAVGNVQQQRQQHHTGELPS